MDFTLWQANLGGGRLGGPPGIERSTRLSLVRSYLPLLTFLDEITLLWIANLQEQEETNWSFITPCQILSFFVLLNFTGEERRHQHTSQGRATPTLTSFLSSVFSLTLSKSSLAIFFSSSSHRSLNSRKQAAEPLSLRTDTSRTSPE